MWLLISNRILRQHSSRVLIPQNLIIAARSRVVINGIVIKRINGQGLSTKLPERIVCDARVLKHSLLPWCHQELMISCVRRAVLLEDDRFPSRLSDGVVLHNPLIGPGVVVAPLVGIAVKGAIVKGGDSKVFHKIDSLVSGICVASVTDASGVEPAFVAEGNHVL